MKVLAFSAFAAIVIGVSAQHPNGYFTGSVVTEWLGNANEPNRAMKLLNTFSYTDPIGKKWPVPSGAIIDGASIPRIFWTLIGSPFTDNYRNASVVHDYYCDKKSEKWEDVHLMFYNACITGGTDPIKAKVMYMAVYAAGPRWKLQKVKGSNKNKPIVLSQKIIPPSDVRLTSISQWIERENPGLQQIRDSLNTLVIVPK